MHHGLQSVTLGRSWTPVAPSPALPAIQAQPRSRVSQSPVTVTAWSQEPLPAGASGREPGPGRRGGGGPARFAASVLGGVVAVAGCPL